jgi:hypothetical protein
MTAVLVNVLTSTILRSQKQVSITVHEAFALLSAAVLPSCPMSTDVLVTREDYNGLDVMPPGNRYRAGICDHTSSIILV